MTAWLSAELQRLAGNNTAVDTALAQAEKRNQKGAKWSFLKATASLYGDDKKAALDSVKAAQRDIASLPRTDFIIAYLHVELRQFAEANAIIKSIGTRLEDHVAFQKLARRVSKEEQQSKPVQTTLPKARRETKKKTPVSVESEKHTKASAPVGHSRVGKTKTTQKDPKSPVRREKGNKVAFRKLMAAGSRHLESGRIKDARRTFRDALKLQPNHPKAYANLGWCAMNEKAYGKAIVQFKAALAKRPRFADGLFGLGYAYEKEGSSASAIRVYKRYLRYYPKGKKSAMVKTRLKQLQPR